MALFQIAEPGLSAAPHEHRLAVGIDLGTTNSLVASVISGSADVIADEQGRRLLPSIVRYDQSGDVVVGADARSVPRQPHTTVSSAKRLIGRVLEDIEHADTLPFALKDGDGMLRIQTVCGDKTPVEVSARILRALAQRAQERLGGDLSGAVITVPAYFDDAQRQATKDAARLANLNVLRLINEPTAAALAYGLDNAAEGLYLIYDLGGGTFDVSLLNMQKGVFEVRATGGDSRLGGDDFDYQIVQWCLQQCPGLSLTRQDKKTLWAHARFAKEALSEQEKVRFTWQDKHFVCTREVFRAMTAPLLEKTMRTVRQVLRDAKVEASDIQGIVLVGGSTRMPQVTVAIEKRFGRTPFSDINPDRVVAIGAAMQANKLVGNTSRDDDWLLLDVTPLSLGLETMGGLVEKVIPRNSPIPIARAQDFTTFKDGQTAMAIHVVQGEREVVDACRSLARFELRGIPPMVAGAARIRVTFEVDADGLLSVRAKELTTGVESEVRVKPSYGLSDDEIVRMLQDGNGNAQQDMFARELREQKVEMQRLLESLTGALATDADLLSPEERQEIDQHMRACRSALQGEDLDRIKQALARITKGTEEFAARRMNRSIMAALAGHSVDEFTSKE